MAFLIKYTVVPVYSSEVSQEHTAIVEDASSKSEVFKSFGETMARTKTDGRIVSLEECTDCPEGIERIHIH